MQKILAQWMTLTVLRYHEGFFLGSGKIKQTSEMTSVIRRSWKGLTGGCQTRGTSALGVESSGFLLLLTSQAAWVAAPLLFAQVLPSVPMVADRLMLRGVKDKQGPSGL